jgi:hypothetical protein
MPNTAIHTDVTTLCNITFAEHLGILVMLITNGVIFFTHHEQYYIDIHVQI